MTEEAAVKACLTKLVPNKFRQILDEPIALDEKLTAIYILALEDDCFPLYRFQPLPQEPTGWREDYEKYLRLDLEDRSEGWRRLAFKYKGYLENKDHALSQNDGYKYFLKEMLEHFEKLAMTPQAEKIRIRLYEFN